MQCGCVSVSLVSSLPLSALSLEASQESGVEAVPVDVVVPPRYESPSSSLDTPSTSLDSPALHELLERRHRVTAELRAFTQECMVKRGNIVLRFDGIRAVVDSSERAALFEYDDAVRAVMKQLEAEVASVDVLSQQLSATLVAFGDATSGFPASIEDVVRPRAHPTIDAVVSLDCLEASLRECWKIVVDCSDHQPLAVARAEVEVGEYVSGFTV
jgi:hypothetical protein